MLRFKRFASSAPYNQAKILRKYPIGAVYHGYEIKRIFPVQELQMVAVDLEHKQTGSQHLHLDRNDQNNVFSMIFKTNPPDKTGVPHILEHTTLCGSEKYPVRDPFFKMLNRSLANFMNAMTAHDYTYYPFATTNLKDFNNLMDIYIDSTLQPLLQHKDFAQEGWRLENTKIDDINSPLIFKGVVYNEMKGQMSNLQYMFYTKFKQAIYPSLNNSGGDPLHITSLHHEDLVQFHSKNYHPSNMKSFTYGSNPLPDTLEKLNDSLKRYGKRMVRKGNASLLKMPITLKENVVYSSSSSSSLDSNLKVNPNKVSEISPIDSMLPMDKQIKSSLTWILNDPNQDVYETFLLKVLNVLLFDSTNSPFYKKLIESGIAYDFSCNTGLESMTNRNFISIGLQGIDSKFLSQEFEQKILEILSTDCLNDKSLYSDMKIQAIINQMELSLKNQQSQFGLTILNHILPQWVNQCDPFDIINFNENIETFKQDFATRGASIFTDLIEKYLINKPYFQFTMTGDENYNKLLTERENELLQEKLEFLEDDDKKIIYERNLQNNKDLLEKKENLDVLPTLKISDIPTNGSKYPVDMYGGEIKNENKTNVYSRITNTNGISYLKFKKNIETHLPMELLPYLSLFNESLTFLGTKTQEYDQIEDEIKLYTGGVSISCHAQTSAQDLAQTNLNLELSGWSLNDNIDHIFKIWLKLLNETDFTGAKLNKLKTLIKSLSSNASSSFSDSGHSYAKSYAAASLSKTFSINEHLDGVKDSKFINYLNNSVIEDESKLQSEVMDKLNQLQKIVLNSINSTNNFSGSSVNNSNENKSFIVTDDSKLVGKFANGLEEEFLCKLNKSESSLSISQDSTVFNKIELLPKNNKTVIDFPFQVYHTSKVLQGVPYVHEDGAKLQILSTLLTNKILHSEIREKNGAYGGGCSFSAIDGIFNFYSYRDPNPMKTMEIFDKLCDSTHTNEFDFQWNKQDLDEAKLSIFQRLDAPISPRNEGSTYFHYGITDALKEKRRKELLNCTLDDVFQAKDKYLLNPSNNSITSRAIVGNASQTPELFQKENYDIIDISK